MERFTREMPIEDKKWPWWMAKPRGRRKGGRVLDFPDAS